MTIPRLKAMTAYWASYPPQHIQLLRIGAALGIKHEPKKEEVKTLSDFINDAMGAGIKIDLPGEMNE